MSSPSGAGKTTLCQNMLKNDEQLTLSVSMTTRPRRDNEIDGIHYNFINEEEFMFNKDKGNLLEWAQVHGHYYGTPKIPVQKTMQEGKDMLFDIDWQGTLQMIKVARDDIVSVFILPPSMDALEKRLKQRAQDTQEVIKQRLENAKTEIKHWNDYDYVIVNDNLEYAFLQLQHILNSERIKRERLIGLSGFVEKITQTKNKLDKK